ncbi:2-amino-4-hydroxy-6-hydroxymethyldihydropteridine diphosphokinase [Ruania alkalisoli]|uniref:Bifunctional folate synthesis protein n=1 Tax=Ruania alkalisoli TaxID=2779775 RepID=A0A7M1SWJ2_9MICO|nr:2-amino-4-hydroxy-6-hydroxymethyldihydropteridine diphosphokinase [Ruania alkalisoli]QOR71407.1 2-amino-4-hydroxy-6-hydroxymethyldihydropteridine diphosphokinase [Ruania alkalisoli]
MTGTEAALDEIRLLGVGGVGRHGVFPEERREGQTFLVDVVMAVDTRAAAASDDLASTVDYAAAAREIVDFIEGEPVNLIETLANRIAEAMLSRTGVRSVDVTVHKPEAPVGVPYSDVQVHVRRSTDRQDADAPAPEPAIARAEPAPARAEPEHAQPDLDAAPEQPVPVVLALGGNVGDVRTTLRGVIADLTTTDGLTVEEISPLARTSAVLQPDAVAQPDYLNAVVLATTTLAPRELLDLAHHLEGTYGRQRTQRWGERTLDVDLIVYGTLTSTDPELTLPHPRANERAFVLVPWAQADPDAFLPGLGGGPVAALAETAPDRAGVRWLALDWLEDPAPRPAPAAAVSPSSPPSPPDGVPHLPQEAPAEPEDDVEEENLEDLELLAHGDEDSSEAAEPESDDLLPWVRNQPADEAPIAPRWQPLHRDE